MMPLRAQKSEAQKHLEKIGCIIKGQEPMHLHEPDPAKPCRCGRPIRNSIKGGVNENS